MTLMSWQHFSLPSCKGYTRQSAQAELARVFAAQYQLTLTGEVEIRYAGDLNRPGDRRDHLRRSSL